jgi:2,4-dienoyl-CoA reductase-like NADH-dependent reductase (Old Yellow Enzyme family)
MPHAGLGPPFFDPFDLKGLRLKNRVVMPPMTRTSSPNGVPGPDVARYYARRAAGEAGLIVTEGVGLDCPRSVDNPRIPVMFGEEALAGWRAVTDAVHAEGSYIFTQLWHQGGMREPLISNRPDLIGFRPSGRWGTPGATSSSPEFVTRMLPDTAPMTEGEIVDVIASYARAAKAAMSAGFDGVAIHGAHGYLIDTFFWADTNHRTDRYGGNVHRRAQFAVDIVRGIREAIGEAPPIMFRFSQHKQQDYNARFAETPEDLGITLNALIDAGVDVLDVSSRRFTEPAFPGSELTVAGWARRLTGATVMTVGGIGLNNWLQDTFKQRSETLAINNLDLVRDLFDKDMFDLIAVGRAMISDPQWAQKARTGEDFLPFDRSALQRLE